MRPVAVAIGDAGRAAVHVESLLPVLYVLGHYLLNIREAGVVELLRIADVEVWNGAAPSVILSRSRRSLSGVGCDVPAA